MQGGGRVVQFLRPSPFMTIEQAFTNSVGRISELPLTEQIPFMDWLRGNNKSRPIIAGVPENRQDGFRKEDYFLWRGAIGSA